MIPPCPGCGGREVYVNAQARGSVKHYFDAGGKFVETFYDELWFKPSKTVRCQECKQVRRDLKLVDPEFVEVVREGEG